MSAVRIAHFYAGFLEHVMHSARIDAQSLTDHCEGLSVGVELLRSFDHVRRHFHLTATNDVCVKYLFVDYHF